MLIVAGAAAGVCVYIALSALNARSGFPLDDAWIHQTYARNFAESGQMAFAPGQVSAGSTSPLWTWLIALGYRLNIDYPLWTYALGALSLGACGVMLARVSLRLWPGRPRLAWAAAALCVFEWHLVWAAASGMETVLFAALGLALLDCVLEMRHALLTGAVGALLVLTRPEGLLLVGLSAPLWWLRSRRRMLIPTALSFGVLLLPVIVFNLQTSGNVFPNTFYAKQQEYAVYFSAFDVWLPRALDVIGAPFVGAQVLLAPGLVMELAALRRRSNWTRALPLAWVAAHVAVYALRLPVTFQHGRYLMPVIPLLLLYGLRGSAGLLERVGRNRLLRRALVGSLIGVTLAFWIVGAGAYRIDVNIIENEVVASARWLAAHSEADALVAAHDIGAIGYFARRPLLDLAGLVSPEVIPIIRDEPKLLALLRARDPHYLAAPPDFYSALLDAPELQQAFVGNSPFVERHWTVYRVSAPPP
jgi:hypothetical protein